MASSVECYMKQFNVSEQQAYILFNERVEDAWKEINGEFLGCKDVQISITMRVVNFARSMDVLYKNKSHFTHVGEELINHIKSLFVNAIVI